jgi:hypothetical protein
MTAYLTAAPGWHQAGTYRGAQIWRHDNGDTVLIPAEYDADADTLAHAAFTITRIHLGLGSHDYPEAVRRLARATCPALWPARGARGGNPSREEARS